MAGKPKRAREPNRYLSIIQSVFDRHFRQGMSEFEFSREELVETAKDLKIRLVKNLGDLTYALRFRGDLPAGIMKTARKDRQWIIELAGRGRYRFRLVSKSNIIPNPSMISIKIPDSTPEIISKHALSQEQALLAKVRYNRLVDTFLGLTTYSLQSHMRTTVKSIGGSQIEIDEVYVGVHKSGEQFVIPVQAKGGKDRLSVVQTLQDVACCHEKFSHLTCRPVSAQFMPNGEIALFELVQRGEEVKLVEERHYKLVPADQISPEELRAYSKH